jgi:hypothetical protein
VGFTDGPLFLYNLSLADKRGLLIPKVYLIVQAVRLVDDRLDDGLYDFAAVHGDADVAPTLWDLAGDTVPLNWPQYLSGR